MSSVLDEKVTEMTNVNSPRVHPADGDGDRNKMIVGGGSEPIYQDKRAVGCELWVAIILGLGLMIGLEMGFSTLVTVLAQGFSPLDKICDCPENAATFGPDAKFYTGCADLNSTWYLKYNNVSENQTFTTSGFFGPVVWTRKNRTERQFESFGVQIFPPANIEVVPDVFECPVFDPFWSPPVNVVGIILVRIPSFQSSRFRSRRPRRPAVKGSRGEIKMERFTV